MTMEIYITGGEISESEKEQYIARAEARYGNRVNRLDIDIDGEYVNLKYHFKDPVPFERIRRITGYLVGTLDRFNNAKRAEVSERVKHGI